MASFRYQALDAAGKKVDGVLEADNARSVRASLRDKGVWVTDIEEMGSGLGAAAEPKKEWLGFSLTRQKKIATKDLAMITRQIATLLSAGLTIEKALVVLVEQSENINTRNILANVRSEVLAGSALSRALSQHPAVFSELYRTIVRAGEESGKAGAVMTRLGDYIEARQALSNKMILAFVYPAVVVVVSMLVITGMLWWVVPQMVTVFETAKQTLPLLTRFFIGLSRGLREYGWIVLVIFTAAGLFLSRALKQEAFRRKLDERVLRLPILGKLNQAGNTAKFASTLSILVGSGVPLLKALEASAGVVGNVVMRDAITEAAREVREGSTLSKALDRRKMFPPVLVYLISSGEASGRLDSMLDSAASQQAGELEQRVSTFTSLLGPIMVLIMGLMVLLIVLAILLPVFEMNQLVS